MDQSYVQQFGKYRYLKKQDLNLSCQATGVSYQISGLTSGAAAALALLWLLVCAPGDAGCHLLTVADLFDRVIRHSGRIHSLSTALYAELEKHFPPRDNELGKSARKCHTSGMLTPNRKEYAQKIPREELTHLILKLLQAWKEPLSHFNQHIEHHQELPDDSLSKAKQISNMVHELKTGVEKVTEKARFSIQLLFIPVIWQE
ncbi:prolactin [Columba guinea]|nr:prolactin [Columba guinea]